VDPLDLVLLNPAFKEYRGELWWCAQHSDHREAEAVYPEAMNGNA